MRPFTVSVPESRLNSIRDRVASFPWDAMPDAGGWSAGASLPFMRDLADYWTGSYDWRAQEAALNAWPQFLAEVEGVDLHFYHVRSPHPQARPLLLIHGWPGSVLEFLHLIGPLTDPCAHGGSAEDAFHLVIPSLPGYGFSGRPAQPIGPGDVARLFATLMTGVLGYESYIAQGGDWGAIVSTCIGFQDQHHCRGIHVNMPVSPSAQPRTDEERAWQAKFQQNQMGEGAYGQLQMTKPQSLGFAMTDSPLGAAAWIVEKFAGWSDLPKTATGEPDVLARYTRDQLLTNVMLYLVNHSFATATWLYRGFALTAPQLDFVRGGKCPVPTGIAAFPDPVFIPMPRTMAERYYNLIHWTEMPRGGHFAAMEAPDLFLDDVRNFARLLPV